MVVATASAEQVCSAALIVADAYTDVVRMLTLKFTLKLTKKLMLKLTLPLELPLILKRRKSERGYAGAKLTHQLSRLEPISILRLLLLIIVYI